MNKYEFYKGDSYPNDDGCAESGIHVCEGKEIVHGNRIVCYGINVKEAEEMRDFVWNAIINHEVDLAAAYKKGRNDVLTTIKKVLDDEQA